MTVLPTLPNIDGQIEAMERALQGVLILKGAGFVLRRWSDNCDSCFVPPSNIQTSALKNTLVGN
jgi:hypothetical protein